MRKGRKMIRPSHFRGFLNLFIIIFISHIEISTQQSSESQIKIHYLGHSSFVLQFDNNITIVTDYGHYNAWANCGSDSPIQDIGELVPNIMTFSHQHDDHCNPGRIPKAYLTF